jgi:ABC-type sugar transport system substrate-binding protein
MSRGQKARLGAAVLGIVLPAALAAGASARPDATAVPTKTALPMKTIGIMGPVDAAEIIKLATDATDQAAKALGWRTVRVDPGGDPAKMGAGMTSLVNARVDAIVLTTIEPATITSGLRAARRARIPVIDTHTKTQSSPMFAGEYFLPPRTEFDVLLRRMRRDLPRGSEIGTVNLPQFLNAKLAGDYIKQAARANGWRIVASHDANLQSLVPDTQRAVGAMLRANPGIDAIFGCCDFVPAGAVPAIRSARSEIKVYALHGVPSAISLARSGLTVLEVADYQRGGIVAIDVLARHFATNARIPKRMPGRYQMSLVDQSNARRGFPYPTSKVLAPFRAKWNRLYIKAQ